MAIRSNSRISLRCLQCLVLFLELRARNSSIPHDVVWLPPLSSLCHCHRSPSRPRPPRRPARFSLHQPQRLSPHDPPKLLPGLREVPEPPTLQLPPSKTTLVTSSLRFPQPEEKIPPDLALRVPQRQRRRLPVTPLPPASHRHRLPQQPANCSATTSLPIGRFHALTTASLTGWSIFAALPSVQCLRIPVSQQGKHRLFPPILSSTIILTSVGPPMHRCAEKMSTSSTLHIVRPRSRNP